MPDIGKGLESLDRAITLRERELIAWLLEHGDPGSIELVAKIDGLRVVGKCMCGCPTVYFAIAGQLQSRRGERLISDHLATVEGRDVGVMLFECNGSLSSLEVYDCAGHDKPFGLPEIESLYSYEDSSARQPNSLTNETLSSSARGENVNRADNTEDLFKKLGI